MFGARLSSVKKRIIVRLIVRSMFVELTVCPIKNGLQKGKTADWIFSVCFYTNTFKLCVTVCGSMCSENMHKKRIKTFMVNTNPALSPDFLASGCGSVLLCNKSSNKSSNDQSCDSSLRLFLYAALSLSLSPRPLPTPLSLSPLLLPPPPSVCGSCLLKGTWTQETLGSANVRWITTTSAMAPPPPPPPPPTWFRW